ncbi:unnamed protein product, partial [marine sediment metagenome]
MWQRRHLLGIEELDRGELVSILDRAREFVDSCTSGAPKHDELKGKTVVLLFFEPSTRTLTSFSLAARRLSADVVSLSRAGSSTVKGETLRDTARNMEAMGADIVVIRHGAAGAPQLLARSLDASIV